MLTTDGEINVHTIEKVAMFKAVYSVSVPLINIDRPKLTYFVKPFSYFV